MVVCLCQGVSEKHVREAVADGATTRKQVTRACGAGAGCGGCHQSIREIISEHRAGATGQPVAEAGACSSGRADFEIPAVAAS